MLLNFFNEIKNQFSTLIHVLRTDNALEYVKKRSLFFVQTMGSQQNGVVKRKHRHIMDVARTMNMMTHTRVPKYL